MFANFPTRRLFRLCLQAIFVTSSWGLLLVSPVFCQRTLAQVLPQSIPSQDLEAAGLYQQGVIRYYRNDLVNAEMFLRQALQRDPNMAAAYIFLGNIMLRQNRMDLAIQNYSESIRINPNFAEGYFNLGLGLHQQGQNQAALTAYRQALLINPTMAAAHYNIGLLLQADGQLSEAIAAYSQAIAFDSGNVDAHFNLAIALQKNGQISEAIQAYRQVISLAPDRASAYNNLGNLLMTQGQTVAAIDVYREGLRRIPDNAELYHSIGLAWYNQGKPQNGHAALKRASKFYRAQDNFAAAEQIEQFMQQVSQTGNRTIGENPNSTSEPAANEATRENTDNENPQTRTELPRLIEFGQPDSNSRL